MQGIQAAPGLDDGSAVVQRPLLLDPTHPWSSRHPDGYGPLKRSVGQSSRLDTLARVRLVTGSRGVGTADGMRSMPRVRVMGNTQLP